MKSKQSLITTTVAADWKDMEGLCEEFKAALKKFGIHIIEDPDMKGSDTYGFILSNRKLTKKEIQKNKIFSGDEEDSWDGKADLGRIQN